MGRRISLPQFHLTFRVAEPEGLAHRLRFPANGVTGQGLGEVTNEVRNVAGKPVLCAVVLAQGLTNTPMLLHLCSPHHFTHSPQQRSL